MWSNYLISFMNFHILQCTLHTIIIYLFISNYCDYFIFFNSSFGNYFHWLHWLLELQFTRSCSTICHYMKTLRIEYQRCTKVICQCLAWVIEFSSVFIKENLIKIIIWFFIKIEGVLLVPLESPRSGVVHQGGFRIFRPMMQALMNFEYSFKYGYSNFFLF
jgi:hypothetical protein